MKKLVALTCAGLMAASVVTGCASNNKEEGGSSDKRVLKVDLFSGGNGEQVFKDLETAFEETHKDVDVQLRVEKELDQVLNKENAKGEYSDVVYYNLGQPSQYTETQLNTKEVMDISDVVKEITIDPAYANSSVVQYYGDGKSYLLPLKTTPAGFFYNTELVGPGKKYELPETWDDMWELGKQLYEEGNGVKLFTYPVKGYFDNTLNALLGQSGGEEFLKNVLTYKEGVWDTKEGRQVLDTIAKLVSSENLYPDTVSNANAKDGFTINQQAVIDGKALFMPNGDWIVNEMEKTTPEKGFHWGLMPLPALKEGGDRYVASMTEQVWIPKQAKNADAAKEFLNFIYSDKGVEIMAKYGNVVPTKGFQDKVDTMEDGYTKEFFSVYKDAKTVIGAFSGYDTNTLANFDLKATVFGPIDEIATGKTTVDEWQKSLSKAWKDLAANPLK